MNYEYRGSRLCGCLLDVWKLILLTFQTHTAPFPFHGEEKKQNRSTIIECRGVFPLWSLTQNGEPICRGRYVKSWQLFYFLVNRYGSTLDCCDEGRERREDSLKEYLSEK